MLDLMARHPLLTCDQLATLLDASRRRVSALQTELVRRGWLRQLTADATRLDPTLPRHPRLFELTLAGRRQSLRRLGLMSTDAARHHGHLPHRSTHAGGCCGISPIRSAPTSSSSTLRSSRGASRLQAATTSCSSGAVLQRVRGAGAVLTVTAATAAVTHATDSLLNTTAPPNELASTPPSWMRTTGFVTQARRPANSRVSRQCWWYPPAARAEDLIAYQAHLAAERHGGSPLPVLLTTTELVRDNATPDARSGLAGSESRDRYACISGRTRTGARPYRFGPNS